MSYYLSVPCSDRYSFAIFHEGSEWCFYGNRPVEISEAYDNLKVWKKSCDESYGQGEYLIFKITKEVFDYIMSDKYFDRSQYIYEKFNLPEFLL